MATPSSNAVPVDVVLEIIARLPVKSLIRFRLISKSLFSVTAAPNFINSHLALSRSYGYVALTSWFLNPPSSIAILDKSFSEVLRPEIPFSFSSRSKPEFGVKCVYFLVGSCNGVLCFTDNWIYGFGRDVVLWNPMIRKFKSARGTSLNSNLLRDVTTKITLGFGFDGKNKDHKIVRLVISKFKNEPSHQAEIYSLSTDSWRRIIFPVNSFSKIIIFESNRCSFVNGALHWLSCVSKETNSGRDTIIISFKLEDEQFKAIRLPQDYGRGAKTFSLDLMVLKRSLVLVSIYEAMEDEVMEEKCRVWKMKKCEEAGVWAEQLLPITQVSYCHGCTEDGEVILSQDGSQIRFYDLETGTLKVGFMEDVDSIVPLRESLVLL